MPNIYQDIKNKINDALLNSKDYSKLLEYLSTTLKKETASANSEETIACKIEDCL